MCLCVYVYVCIHTYIHTHFVQADAYVRILTYIHTCIHTYIHTQSDQAGANGVHLQVYDWDMMSQSDKVIEYVCVCMRACAHMSECVHICCVYV